MSIINIYSKFLVKGLHAKKARVSYCFVVDISMPGKCFLYPSQGLW